MAASTPPSGTAYPVVSAAQKQRSRSRSGLTGMLIGPRAKTMAVSDGPRLSHTVARTPSAPLLRMVAGQPPHQGDDRTDLYRVQTPSGRGFTRRRGWLGIAAEPETYQPAVKAGREDSPSHAHRRDALHLGYVRAGGEAAEAEDHAGAVG
jgi:hypothetical protein